MKKILIALALGMVLVLALATVATADNGPHGGFNGSTDACASCHRIHSGVSSDGMLLVAGDIYELCTSCHDGTGAFTNVVDGYYDTQVGDPGKSAFAGGWGDAGVGLFGGGFENARMLTDYGNASNEGGLASPTNNALADMNLSATSWALLNKYDTVAAAPLARVVTSTHDVEGLGAYDGSGTIWGSGDFNAGGNLGNNWGATAFTGAAGDALECTSCHDPHGNAGRNALGQPYPSYRLLRYEPHGSNGFEVASEVATNGYWDTDVNWAGTAGGPLYVGKYALLSPIAPSAAGVLVPDTPVYWYSVNNDNAQDNTLEAYRSRSNGMYVSISAGQGDYGALYRGYTRPSVTLTNAGTEKYQCWDGSSTTATTSLNLVDCAAVAGTNFNNKPAHDVLGFWCSTCHDRYLAPGSASRSTDSGDPGYHYRHRAQAISSTSMGNGQYTCVDCHNAHGTAATADTLAGNASYAGGSILLKADNRAICLRCHASAVNFFNVVTSPNAMMVDP